jgi:hypothetical protein
VLRRKRLGVRDVQRSLNTAGLELGQQIICDDDRSAGSVNEQRTVVHTRQELAVDHMASLVRHRDHEYDDVSRRQQFRQLFDGVHSLPSMASDHRRHGVEGEQASRSLLAQITGTYDQDPLFREFVGRMLVPLPAFLGSHEARKLAQAREDRGQHPLSRRAAGDPTALAERDALGDQADEMVDPGTTFSPGIVSIIAV